MGTRKSFFQMFSVFLVIIFLLVGVLPAQAESHARPFYAGGDFLWAKGMGGTANDVGEAIAVDSSGNVYTTGSFLGIADFDPGAGIFNLISAGAASADIFISKLDSSGNFVWARSMGGKVFDAGLGIAVDSSGNVYTTGAFSGTVDFDPGAGTFNLTSAGWADIYVSKLNSSGNFVWAKSMGSVDDDEGHGIAVDVDGSVYTTGLFFGIVDFDPGAGITNLTHAGNLDIFVSKLDGSGNFVWAKSMGGTNYEFGTDIAVDSNKNVYTTGAFYETVDFNPGAGTTNLTSAGLSDIFISKLDSNGDFTWAKRIGGTDYDFGSDISLDSSGNVYSTGSFHGAIDFDPGAGTLNLTSAGFQDIFVSKLDNSGNFVWAKNMGGTDADEGYSIAIDSSGNVYTTGLFGWGVSGIADFDPGLGIFNLTTAGERDIFVSKLDSSGNFVWAKSMGGTQPDYGENIALDSSGNVYTTGGFLGTADFDPGPGIFNLTSAGEGDIFVSKLGNDSGGLPTFADVPLDHPLYKYIEALYDGGFTAGCSTSPLMFCPDQILDRAQSAVFMLRGQLGSGYTPPPAPWNTFLADSWVGFEYAQPWAEGMWQEGLTEGCQTSPLMYCPATQLPRVEASIFGLKMKYGNSYLPPPATGTLFADFPSTDPSYWGIAWAEQAYKDGLLPACGTLSGKPMFCPGELVNRGWGAYLIVKAKGLPTP